MALERVYNIPLRKEFQKAPRYKRAKKAVNALRNFLKKHMKSEDIKIGKQLNLKIWKHGIKNPPHHVKVNAVKDDKGIVKTELYGIPYEEVKEKKKEAKKGKEEKKEGKKQIKKELGKLKEKTKQIKEKEGTKKEGKKAMKKKLEKELKEKK